MKTKFFLLVLFLCLAVATQIFLACGDDDDDDNDDTNGGGDDDTQPQAPDIPHGNQGAPCMDCHTNAHGGDYTSDDCLNCHSY